MKNKNYILEIEERIMSFDKLTVFQESSGGTWWEWLNTPWFRYTTMGIYMAYGSVAALLLVLFFWFIEIYLDPTNRTF